MVDAAFATSITSMHITCPHPLPAQQPLRQPSTPIFPPNHTHVRHLNEVHAQRVGVGDRAKALRLRARPEERAHLGQHVERTLGGRGGWRAGKFSRGVGVGVGWGCCPGRRARPWCSGPRGGARVRRSAAAPLAAASPAAPPAVCPGSPSAADVIECHPGGMGWGLGDEIRGVRGVKRAEGEGASGARRRRGCAQKRRAQAGLAAKTGPGQ